MKNFLCVLVFICSASQANAEPETFKFDPSHTQIVWSVDHFGFSHPAGKFVDIAGTVTLDEAKPAQSSVEVTIKTAAFISGIDKLDEHMKGKDFLNVEKFPTAKFVSTKVKITKDKRAEVTGELTLLGVTKSVILDVKLNKIAIHQYTQRKTVGFSAKTSIKRSDFGMTFGIGAVSDEVKLSIESEAVLEEPEKATK